MANQDKMMTVDGLPVIIKDEKNLLELIRRTGKEMPTFCYHTELSVFGACRMCMVEDERGRLMTACSTPPAPGMNIRTNTERLRKYRKNILELLLAEHCRDCTTCPKSGKCRLQDLAVRFGVDRVRFEPARNNNFEDKSSPCIVRRSDKCILCGDCVRVCEEVQNVGAIGIAYRGSDACVTTPFNVPLIETTCVGCGQCVAACPTGALSIHSNVENLWGYLDDPSVFVSCEVAPAVRVAFGREMGLNDGENAMGKIVTALHRMGFDAVFDTATGADLTVIEEANELVERLENGGVLPMFTSCCPAWVQHVEKSHPELLPNVSTCRSPMSMFAAVVKDHFDGALPEGKTSHIHVAIMPCTAKKYEADRDEFKVDGVPGTDFVVTTQELIGMIRESGLEFAELYPEALDLPFGETSGSGVIFGVTGGVTEAVLRKVSEDNSRASLYAISYSGVRGMEGIKETTVPFKDGELKIAVCSGLANADKLIEKIESGEAHYDIVEVMACPGGCVSGAGQPYVEEDKRAERGRGLYSADLECSVKRSEDNSLISELYEKQLSGRVHELLHVDYLK